MFIDRVARFSKNSRAIFNNVIWETKSLSTYGSHRTFQGNISNFRVISRSAFSIGISPGTFRTNPHNVNGNKPTSAVWSGTISVHITFWTTICCDRPDVSTPCHSKFTHWWSWFALEWNTNIPPSFNCYHHYKTITFIRVCFFSQMRWFFMVIHSAVGTSHDWP